MKKLFYLLTICSLILFSCKKSKETPIERNDLMGTWTLTTTYNNDGARTIYTDVNDPTLRVNFGTDGKFSSNVNGYKEYNRYEMQEGNKLQLINSLTGVKRPIPYTFTSNKLTMHFNECFEPCGEIFSPTN